MLSPNEALQGKALEARRVSENLSKIAPMFREDFAYNVREKWITDADGCAVLLERIIAERKIFNPEGVEGAKKGRQVPDGVKMTRAQLQELSAEEWERLRAADAALSGDKRARLRQLAAEAGTEYASNATEWAIEHGTDMVLARDRENRERAARRARRKVSDYVMAEHDFKYFITLTLNGDYFPRSDVATATKRLNTWLKNRVQREGLKYIIVPEYHKDGKSLHFHGFINDALRVVDSGCVVNPEGGKPIRRETARRKGYDPLTLQTVYNIPEWLYGFTTAIELYGDRAAAAAYISKYITKQYDACGGDRTMIGGRYYWHSNNLREPQMVYRNADFENWPGDAFDTPGGQMKIEYFVGGKIVEREG